MTWCEFTFQQCTYNVNIEARSRNHCCRGNARGKYYKCVSVFSFACRTNKTSVAVPYCCFASRKRPDFRGKCRWKYVFWFPLQLFFFLKRFSLLRSIQRDIVNCSLMKFEFSGQIFEEFWNTTFYENPCSGSPVVPCEQTYRHDEIQVNKSLPFVTNVTNKMNKSYIFSQFLTPTCFGRAWPSSGCAVTE